MRHILSIIGVISLIVIVAGCSSTADLPAYENLGGADTTLEEWAESYPLEYQQWSESVHGEAYLAGNRDVPACTGCHGDPASGEIETAKFHLEISSRCGSCHADQTKMSPYDIKSDVYDTYLADYHGATINYFLEKKPNEMRFEAVCSDCHGSHAIYASDVAVSSVSSENLTATCQKCHPGSNDSFTSATGHYAPIRATANQQDGLLIYLVKLFYQALIPIVLGLMIAYVGLDIAFRIRRKRD